MDNKEILEIAAEACDNVRAEEIVALNMNQVSLVADYFLICEGNTERQVQAIARSIKDSVEEREIASIKRMEGFEQARWVLVDLGDVVCHIFHKDERSYYNLERLWGDASQIPLQIGQER
ncbi:ribosome silencing factor [Virgibacillus alimentarius]|uniref:Ribosomal silencing factor RsfS n=1 Tax=Virgibacillus alimentarius TaxID=698769 RepID=A0ABS4S502_9BACI|nr:MULTISPECIES: ribosome silencing factor [Virgibacillus]MBP2256570.1 ribosome-associated protein [Virgibacillus alimentarius]HLR66516.1 ribosome silencing factor [Virgibacillus sp.]